MMALRYYQLLLIVFCSILYWRDVEPAPGFVQTSGFVKVDKFEDVTVFWELVDVQVREDRPMAREFAVGGSTVLYYDRSIAISSPDLDISYVGNDTFIGFSIKNMSLEYFGSCQTSIDLSTSGGSILTDSTPVLYVQTHPMTPTIHIPYDPIAGGPATIICTADSLSMPEESRQDVNMIYSWMIVPPREYFVLQNNTNNQINSTIIVEDLEKNGSLDIQCTASEDGSSFEAVYDHLELIPYYAPGAVLAVSSNVTAIVGEKIILQVTSEDKGYPEGNYTWQFPDESVQKHKPNQLNLIANLSHSGNFTCYLENVVGVGDSATILVTVKDLPTCQSSCKNGGTCNQATLKCICLDGFTGDTCDKGPDDPGAECKWWCILLIVLPMVIVVIVIICCCWHYKVACFRHKCCPWSSNHSRPSTAACSKVDVNDVERTVTSGSHGNKQDAGNKDSPYRDVHRPDGNMPQKGGSHGLHVPQGVPVTNSDQKRPMPSPGRKTVLPPLEDPERSKKKKKKNRKSREEE